MTRVMDLPNWPPEPGGFRGRGRNPTHPDQVTIEKVLQVVGSSVGFSCMFDGTEFTYQFNCPDDKVAKKIATILRDNAGNILLTIGTMEIPPD